MNINVTFRHMESTDALKKYAESKIEKLSKYSDELQEAHVILITEKTRHIADVTLVTGGITLRGEETSADMYASIDAVTDKLGRQLNKFRDRIKRTRGQSGASVRHVPVRYVTPEGTGADEKAKEARPHIVEAETYALKPMFADDAALQLEMNERENFLVFHNAETNAVNVIYRTKDGNFGIIEPES